MNELDGPKYKLVINGYEVELAPETITIAGTDHELTPAKMVGILFDLIKAEYIRRVEAGEDNGD